MIARKLKQASYKKLGEKNGAPRIWLEGLRLAESGFDVGAEFIALQNAKERTITLRIASSDLLSSLVEKGVKAPTRKVSQRKRPKWDNPRPIVDIVGQPIKNTLGDVDRIQVTYSEGEIVVRAHHEDVAKAERRARFLKEFESGCLSVGSMCTGGGIAAQAVTESIESLGLSARHTYVADMESNYIQSGLENNPSVASADIVFEGALEEINPDLIPKASVVQFSLPCTGHSISGKSKNKIKCAEEHGSAATSVFGMINFIRRSQPAVILSENVKEAKDSATYSLIRAELNRMGYKIAETILDGSHAGTLENRVRYWLVAIDEGLLKGQEFSLDIAALPKKHKRLSDIMEDVPDDHPSWSDNQYLVDKAVRDMEKGNGFANRQLLTGSEEKVGVIGRHYNKRRSSEPFFVKKIDGIQKERLFTVREHADVKGIDPALVQGIPVTTAHEIMGQSILPKHCFLLTREAIKIATGTK